MWQQRHHWAVVTGCGGGADLGGSVVGVIGHSGDDFSHRRSSRGEGEDQR
jgi:hypothetical protein